jgi:molybdopterin-containing oxidoreductase family iron-sulfur binding subunit
MSEERDSSSDSLDLAQVRERLGHMRGPQFWRSLEELSRDPRFEDLLHREFPRQAAVWPESVDRRRFLQLAGASLALAGLSACTRQPAEEIIPYVEQPEELVPGKPLYFASGFELDGYANGILVESHLGRPTKIEGNPEHPASLGATDLFAQASILSLYDPDRSQVVRHLNRIRTWSAFLEDARQGIAELQETGGSAVRLLTNTVTSPSLADHIRWFLGKHPGSRWHQYSPVGRHTAAAGARLAFGKEVATRYDFRLARVVVSLDADFLNSGPGAVRYARDFMGGRRVRSIGDTMNRLYVAETTPTGTGAVADHRLPVSALSFDSLALALAHQLKIPGATAVALDPGHREWIEAVAKDLEAHRGASVVVPGECCSPSVHALAHIINEFLENVGRTVLLTDPVEASPVDQMADLKSLVEDMSAGEVDTLLILGANPVFDAPADLSFAEAMARVPRRVHLGLYEDETAAHCHWHVPQAHDLESWGDARSFDGTVTLRQPLIEPLYGGKTALEIVSALTIDEDRTSRLLLEGYWSSRLRVADFESIWRQWVHDGFVADSALPPRPVSVRSEVISEITAEMTASKSSNSLALVFRPDPSIYDGRYANNGWLQECPKPLTKLTWDNPALVGPALARRLELQNGEVVVLEVDGRSLEAPIWIQPGQPDDTVTLHLGYGRSRAGRVGSETGFDAYALRTSAEPWRSTNLKLAKTGRRYSLASTQLHHNIPLESEAAEHRHLVRTASLSEFQRDPEFAEHLGHASTESVSLYPPYEYDGYSWGMSIDLGACTACNTCIIACQSENNIPVVGKEQVQRGREMHWLRIDRYFEGDPENPEIHHQAVLCMHCEQAPCEVVCPVAATTHSSEGLNEMTYNRCVGTRYCSNNCPYKVRRFNFLKYNDFETPILKLLRNPDVTVRARGVMEKCTYCVQRINQARIQAEREARQIGDGEIRTACQQVCPTEAVAFGNLNDPASEVSRRKATSLDYGILEELSTRPRTTYLARLRNPNPELSQSPEHT